MTDLPVDYQDAFTPTGALDELPATGPRGLNTITGRINTLAAASRTSGIVVTDSPYNAKGDGVTNDTAAFNAARAAAGVGGKVYVPPGIYIVNNVALTLASQKWEFAPGAHMKLPAGATVGVLFLVTGDRCTLDGGEWDGNQANTSTQVFHIAIEVSAAHCIVRNAYVHDTFGPGIGAHPATATSTIDGTVIENCTVLNHVHFAGILLDCTTYVNATVPSRNVRVSGCSVISTRTGLGNWSAFYFVGSSTHYLEGGVFENCYVENWQSNAVPAGQFHEGFFWRYTDGVQVTGCFVGGCTLPYTFGLSRNSEMAGCTSLGSWFCGIEIGGDQFGCSITACTIDGRGTAIVGILTDNTPNDDLAIVGNTIRGIALKGLSMQTGGNNWAIVGNTIRAQGTGIEIYSTAQVGTLTATTNLVIAGNLLVMDPGGTGGFYGGIDLDPQFTGARGWSVRNNTLIGWLTRGILIEHATALTASNITVRGNTYVNTGSILTLLNVTLDASCVTEDWGVTYATLTGAEILANKIFTAPKINAAAGIVAPLDLQSGGINRWTIRRNDDTESSTYGGSNFEIVGYNNSGGGSFIGFSINRDTGWGNFIYGLSVTNPSSLAGAVVTVDGVQTETNKRYTPRVNSAASNATPALDPAYRATVLTAQAAAITAFSLASAFTPEQPHTIRIKDNGTARAITWTSAVIQAADGVTLPTTTVVGKTHRVECVYDEVVGKLIALSVASY